MRDGRGPDAPAASSENKTYQERGGEGRRAGLFTLDDGDKNIWRGSTSQAGPKTLEHEKKNQNISYIKKRQ